MKYHKLKIWPFWYDEVAAGRMTFQVRNEGDRCFQAGDGIELNAWDTQRGEYVSGKAPLYVRIIAVYRVPGLQLGYVGLSIRLESDRLLREHTHSPAPQMTETGPA